MKKHIIDEKTGISYTLVGDYYIPDLVLPESDYKPIGVFGRMRLEYIKEHEKLLYNIFLLSGELNGYLADINKQAQEMYERITVQMAIKEGITEDLKEEDQIEWVRRIGNIQNRAREIVYSEIIYN